MRVLIVSPEAATYESLRVGAVRGGHLVAHADATEAVRQLRADVVDVLLLDQELDEPLREAVTIAWRTCVAASLILVVDTQDYGAIFDCDEIVLRSVSGEELGARLSLLERAREAHGGGFARVLAMALSAAGDVVELTDPNAIIQWVNPAFERVLGYAPDEALGSSPARLIRSDMHEPGFFRNIEATLAVGNIWSGVFLSRTKDERLVHLEATISPVKNARGEVTHHVAVKRDITPRVRADRELRELSESLAKARDAALDANRAKSQFLANMSHELRTPLNAIIGYSEMLAEEAEDVGATEAVSDLGKIRSAGTHLLTLINQVLDISKIEAGRMELYVEAFDVPATVEAIAATLRPLAEERGNELVVEIPSDIGLMRSDITKLRQTLLNLLSNANKFTSGGVLRLLVSREMLGGRDWLSFDVHDEGIGMSDEQVRRVFEPFEQADASTTRKFGGTGLGLAISHRFAEMMGGSIQLRSTLGQGSCFTLRLPAEVEAGDDVAERHSSVNPADATHVVLVIDDDPTIHDLLIRTLGKHQYRVECVDSGLEGMRRARELGPDVIVLDVMMPGMDGWSVLAALKKDERTAQIPVVMLTMVEQEDVGYALGASDYLLKPIDSRRLLSAIRDCSGLKGGLILVVEDDAPTREMMRRTLRSAGHAVQEAENGRVALESMAEARPDLVILDLMIPELDGFEVLEAMGGTPELASIPVIVATAKDLSPTERRLLDQRAERVLDKGAYSRRELLDLIRTRAQLALTKPSTR